MIRKNTLKSAGKSVVSILFAIIWAFPCVWMILSSFKPTSELFSYPLHLFPQEWTMLNFHKALQEFDILQYMGNSVFVAIVATIFTVLFSCMCGFALAKYDSKWLSFFFLCRILLPIAFTGRSHLPSSLQRKSGAIGACPYQVLG